MLISTANFNDLLNKCISSIIFYTLWDLLSFFFTFKKSKYNIKELMDIYLITLGTYLVLMLLFKIYFEVSTTKQ